MDSQYYNVEFHVRAPSGELITICADGPGPAGLSVEKIRARTEKVALAQVPGGRVEGYRISTDGRLV